MDIYGYMCGNAAFPHDPTMFRQWCTESQFESYRMLGFSIVEQLCKVDHSTAKEWIEKSSNIARSA